jgi:uncharacterized protein (TIGR04255 family)
MTVNDTNGYIWADFRERCARAVGWLYSAHPARDKLTIQDLTLRYIDAVNVDFCQESVFEFLRDRMKTNILLPPTLFGDGRVKQNPAVFNWQVSFANDRPGGLMTLRFATGKHEGKPALVWETLVQTTPDSIPALPDGFPEWLDQAHELTDDWFFKLIEGDLEKRFSSE